MRVFYHFDVKSNTRTKGVFPLFNDYAEFAVSTDKDGIVTKISIGYKVDDPSLWPKVVETPNELSKLIIKMHSPHIENAQRIIRAAEGALSFYGIEQINWQNPTEEYVPDSPEEHAQLAVYTMSSGSKRRSALDKDPIAFSIIATALLRTDEISAHEIPLAFFRKGTNDANEDRHIEACIEFLFMLETLFANGKFKKNQVIAEFSSSQELIQAIQKTQADHDLISIAEYRGASHRKKLVERYMAQSIPTAIKNIVELRGFLHHHSKDAKNQWHPDRHEEFLADALFLQFVCSKAGLELFIHNAFTEKNKAQFLHCYERSKKSPSHT